MTLVFFIFWPMLPSAMYPPVLAGVFPDEFLDGLCIFRRNPFQRIILISPFLGKNNAVGPEFEIKTIIDSPAVSDNDRYIISNSDQTDTFISACLSAKEIDKNPLSAGVLIGNKAERRAFGNNLFHHSGGAFFVKDCLAGSLAEAV